MKLPLVICHLLTCQVCPAFVTEKSGVQHGAYVFIYTVVSSGAWDEKFARWRLFRKMTVGLYEEEQAEGARPERGPGAAQPDSAANAEPAPAIGWVLGFSAWCSALA